MNRKLLPLTVLFCFLFCFVFARAEKVEELLPADPAILSILREALGQQRESIMNANNGNLVTDLDAEWEKLVNIEKYDKKELRRRFQGCAIIGDSIVEGFTAYEWLPETNAFGKIGAKVSLKSENVQNALRMNPSVLFFVYGANDIMSYGSRFDLFTSRYRECLEGVQAALPDARIYVHAIFEPKKRSIDPSYQYLDEYNEALREMCNELGLYFIDSGFILRKMPSLYEPDQVHMSYSFYPMWLTYLEDAAGLFGLSEQ